MTPYSEKGKAYTPFALEDDDELMGVMIAILKMHNFALDKEIQLTGQESAQIFMDEIIEAELSVK